MEKIKIKYLSDKIERLRYIDGKSDWIDLRAAERVELKKGEFKLIPLGVAMQLPQGFEAHIVPASWMKATAATMTSGSCRHLPSGIR